MKRNKLNPQDENDIRIQTDIKYGLLERIGIFSSRLMMKSQIAFCCLLFTSIIHAATVDITAEFSADISKPQNNQFTNTTPVSGFCAEFLNVCTNGTFSIAIPGVSASKYIDEMTHDYISELPSVTVDGSQRTITLTEKNTGRTIVVSFRITFIAMDYTLTNIVTGTIIGLDGLSNRPLGGCTAGNMGSVYNTTSKWGWGVPAKKVDCYGKIKQDAAGIPLVATANINNFSLGYSLQTPDPLNLYGGTYEGEVVYSLGDSGEDIGFHAQSTSDSEIRLHITAIVNHAFNIFFPDGKNNLDVRLDAQDGWNQWRNGGRIPESLQKDVPFLLTSSTPFVVKMQCGFDGGNQNCGLENTQTHEVVPLEVMLTLPGFKSNGTGVNNLQMTSAANGQAIDPPGGFITDRSSHIDFRVLRPGVETMVKSPGSTWKGLVTLIFDTQTQ
ncbi:hypothetical protein [Kosakonia oryzae]|uniref:Uncharacterized protein n=1 Tax=Kosakonia oryzae TaxID=497725 RepID=A0AA94KPY9_9ENTR|nr:hypothetical protein [Kosakonia oryzae]ANI81961.1 hypothetical protein AWR26_07290 [Kosakonia oryzae]SFC42994.1 hypothetical protein SAMN05216286_2255 [Kosakonia oryzae]